MLDASVRARLYAFYSRLFVREIDDAFADVLRGPLGREVLADFSRSPDADALGSTERRVALFDTDFAHLTMVDVVPYESFYRREDGMIEAGGANPVASFMTRYGFEADLASARSLAPDHLGIELELMTRLCEREAVFPDQAPAARRVQREFLESHLLAWAPVYLLAVKRNARTVLYRDGADGLLHLLHQHHEGLAA